MPKYCVYCGNPLKASDKFCIICGKPVLTDVSKSKQNVVDKAEEIKKEKTIVEEPEEFEILEEPPKKETIEISDGSGKKKKKKAKGESEEKAEKPLPFEVKEQMILFIEFSDIQLNKSILLEKLKDIQESIKDPRYDVDEDFKNTINVKVDALKTLINELKQKEADLKQKMEEPFIVQRIKNDIDTKIYQLKNLTREFKLHKVDKSTFENLREKYVQEKAELEVERKDLIIGMKLWIKELKIEKAELESQRNLNKGRFSAKEITEDDFDKSSKEFKLKLKKIDVKIDTLERLIK